MFMNWFSQKYPYTDFHELNFDVFITQFKAFVEALCKIDSWIETHEDEYKELQEKVEQLYTGDFPPEFVDSLIKWYEDHIVDIIGELVKMVFFGITDDGYFVAYIPDSWADITFGTTGLDDFPSGIEYGHLTLGY